MMKLWEMEVPRYPSLHARAWSGRFPHWAPPGLVKHHGNLVDRIQNPKAGDNPDGKFLFGLPLRPAASLVQTLLTDPRMDRVWSSVARWSADFERRRREMAGKAYLKRGPEFFLLDCCEGAIREWARSPRLTVTQTRERYERLSEQAQALAMLLIDLEDSDLGDISGLIGEDALARGLAGVIDGWDGGDAGSQIAPDYLKFWLSDMLGGLPRLLIELSKRAEERAETPPAMRQPNSPNAHIHYFVARLANRFTEYYGRPLHENVATVANVVLGSDIDKDNVKALLRARKAGTKRVARTRIAKLFREIEG